MKIADVDEAIRWVREVIYPVTEEVWVYLEFRNDLKLRIHRDYFVRHMKQIWSRVEELGDSLACFK